MRRISSIIGLSIAAIAAGLLIAWGMIRLTKGPTYQASLPVEVAPSNPVEPPPPPPQPPPAPVQPIAATRVPTGPLPPAANLTARDATRRSVVARVALAAVQPSYDSRTSIAPVVLNPSLTNAAAALAVPTINLSRLVP